MGIIIHRIKQKKLIKIDKVDDIKLNEEVSMGIDCSSTCTGLCIATKTGVPLYTFAVKRDSGDDYILYKVKLKALFLKLFKQIPSLNQVYYEEPFLGYAESSKILLTLRTTIQEIKYENTPDFDYIKFNEVSNQTWKRLFLEPEMKVPGGKDAQKAAVRKKLEEVYFDCFKDLTQDEVDATAMTMVCTMKVLVGLENEITSSKKTKPFQYEVRFLGANTDEEMYDNFSSISSKWKIPKKIVEDSYKLITLNGRGNFDDKVYASMGEDDRVIVLKYKSDKYGNITLAHRIGSLAHDYDFIYAVVWRKRRKVKK